MDSSGDVVYTFCSVHEVVITVLNLVGNQVRHEDLAKVLQAELRGGRGEGGRKGGVRDVVGPGCGVEARGVGWGRDFVAAEENEFATGGAEMG